MVSSSQNILIVTTYDDISLKYFLADGLNVAYFDDDTEKFTSNVNSGFFDIVYIRDPFNTAKLALEAIAPKIEFIKATHPNAYYVDKVNDIEGVLIEDKWHQYQKWGVWMPSTWLGGEIVEIIGPIVAKKRISARSRDILFDVHPSDVSSEWIVQERLDIHEEIRVYILFGRPVKLASMRRPKQPNQTTKVIDLRPLTNEEDTFVQEVALSMSDYDLMGLDIAATSNGLRLIEANRSPQFRRYNELSGRNLVAEFWTTIRKILL